MKVVKTIERGQEQVKLTPLKAIWRRNKKLSNDSIFAAAAICCYHLAAEIAESLNACLNVRNWGAFKYKVSSSLG